MCVYDSVETRAQNEGSALFAVENSSLPRSGGDEIYSTSFLSFMGIVFCFPLGAWSVWKDGGKRAHTRQQHKKKLAARERIRFFLSLILSSFIKLASRVDVILSGTHTASHRSC